ITITGQQIAPGYTAFGTYYLDGGSLLTGELSIGPGSFSQSAATNQVSGDAFINGNYYLSGGSLITGRSIWNCEFFQSGGFYQTGSLRVDCAYHFSSGQMIVDDIFLNGGGTFYHTGGSLLHRGLLRLNGGIWQEQTSYQELGMLQLALVYAGNSSVFLPTNN